MDALMLERKHNVSQSTMSFMTAKYLALLYEPIASLKSSSHSY